MKLRTVLALMLAAPAAFAAPITVGDQQKISNTAQTFQFNFNALPASSGAGGKLNIVLNGDFSTNDANEYADFTFEGKGTISLGGAWTNGIKANAVNGLSFSSYVLSSVGSADDRQRSWEFNLSDVLLNALIADSKFKVTVKNSGAVQSYNQTNQDFIDLKFTFSPAAPAADADVPEPTSLALAGLGLGMVALARRRRKSA